MKKHMKKWLALILAAVMLTSLALPVMAAEAEDTVTVDVVFIYPWNNQSHDHDHDTARVQLTMKTGKATALAALKAADDEEEFVVKRKFENTMEAPINVAFSFNRDNSLKDVTLTKSAGENREIEPFVPGEMKTRSWAVAVNGRRVEGDLSAVQLNDKDEIVVYLYDAFFDTKLVQVDDSNIAAGILSFYYYDAEGNRQPLIVGVSLVTQSGDPILNLLDPILETDPRFHNSLPQAPAEFGLPDTYYYQDWFAADEAGQIWIAPYYLTGENELKVDGNGLGVGYSNAFWEALTEEEQAYFYKYQSMSLGEFGHLLGRPLTKIEADMYDTAGATGDMTVVYALIGAAAAFTLGAVVLWKTKKRVGAE